MTASLRALARWLELRSFGLNPEQVNMADGIRAAVAVAVPLILVLASGQTQFGWAIFAAFWTCLANAAGPKKVRRRLLIAFVLEGMIVSFISSYYAGLGSFPGFAIAPLLIVATTMLPMLKLASPTGAMLLGVVAVVATSYPRTSTGAGMLALVFLCGGSWANLLLLWLWPINRWQPTKKAIFGVYDRLSDMLEGLIAVGDGQHPDRVWHPNHAQHRRAVRAAIERASSQLNTLVDNAKEEDADENNMADKAKLIALDNQLALAEVFFRTSIALDHLFQIDTSPPNNRILAAEAILSVLETTKTIMTTQHQESLDLAEQVKVLNLAASGIGDEARCILDSLAKALTRFQTASTSGEKQRTSRITTPVPANQKEAIRPLLLLQSGSRTAASVSIVHLVAHFLNLGYPYWASMAVIVVMQPGMRMTWSRSLERILGSMIGGLIASLALGFIANPGVLVVCAMLAATITLAVRTVNYTLFVTFLTLLFVIVIELLQAGAGLASARILDNVVGSSTAILTALLLWPDSGEQISELITKALAANRGCCARQGYCRHFPCAQNCRSGQYRGRNRPVRGGRIATLESWPDE